MRGTKHDASQHQRRGIRSRLIASVAAVAMLATSIAAGTAVAADIDEADPTQQNTIVEQPQQGTENAGDQTGEQNTEPEGEQTDQPQESGDTATETESDATTEADSTEESDPKTDSDKADSDQSAEKQSAAVPAPQAANAVADESAGVAVQADEGSGTELLTEDFTGTNLSEGWSFPSSSEKVNSACLTATGKCSYIDGTKNYQGAQHGDGFLQLTDNSGGKTGTVLYDGNVQSRKGLDIQFYQWQFGGNEHADGIGFFLTDGNHNLTVPGPTGSEFGGALGYSAIQRSGKTEPGIAYGVLGIGLDSWGNFSAKDSVGGDDTRDSGDTQENHRYSVTVRGPGGSEDDPTNWRNGYAIVEQQQVGREYLSTGAPEQEWRDNHLVNKANEDSNGTFVRILLDVPETSGEHEGEQHLQVFLRKDGDPQPYTAINTYVSGLPELIDFGFSASTGGETDAHFIRGLKVSTVEPLESDLFMSKNLQTDTVTINGTEYQGTDKKVFSEGDEIPYRFTVQNVGGQTLTNVNVEDPYIQNIVCEADELAPKAQMTCVGQMTLSRSGEMANGWNEAGNQFTNVATASGIDEQNNRVSDSDDETVNTIPSLGAPDHRKRIRKNDDGTYTLALDATAASVDSTIEGSGKPLDIVLVLDTSGSMAESFGSVTRHVATYNITESKPARGFFGWYQQNAGEYYVLVDGEYKRVHENTEKVWEGNRQFDQHVSWDIDGKVVVPITSRYDTDGKVQFYMKSEESVSRREALQDAANKFIDQIAEKNGTLGQDKKIRVSIVTFAGRASLKNGLTVCEGNDSTRLKSTVNNLGASGATNAGDGMTKANTELQKNARNDATQMVVFFTDGVPTTSSTFNTTVADTAVTQAGQIKSSGGIVYSVGIFPGADPGVHNADDDSDETVKANTFMNAVSSNYPNASSWNTLGNRAEGDTAYYKTAADAGSLSEVFQDIFDESTQTYTYTDLWITDELSEYAQMADDIEYDESQPDDGFYKVTGTGGASVQVWSRNAKEPEGNNSTVPDFFGAQLNENQYSLWWNPDSNAIRVKITSPEAGKLYTLTFNIKPTDKAYIDYASNNTFAGNKGDLNTDLPGNVTSSDKPGFNTNAHAYVSYRQNTDNELKTDDYDHPVLQVELTPADVDADAFVQVRKVLSGRDWESDDSFTFTLTGADNAPMPCEQPGDGNTCSVTINSQTGNDHQLSFGGVAYTKPGTYTYTVSEKPLAAGETSNLDYSQAEYQVTVTVSLDQATPGKLNANVEVAMTKNDAGETLYDPSVQKEPVAVFRNALNTYTYGDDATDKLGLRKVLEGKQLEKGEFTFVLQDVTDYSAEGAPAKPIQDSTTNLPLSEDGVSTTNMADGGIQFGSVLFTAPGVYTVKVSESEGDEAGIVYDKHALYVRYTLAKDSTDGVLKMMNREYYVSQDGSEPGSDANWTPDWDEKIPGEDQLEADLTWTNHYIAVSSLPLTGGRSTARTLLLAGGGVLLVAGAAWLLARRRRV